MKTYTIKDIARLADVSVTTVSRVLNHRPDVNKVTRAKVEKIIEEYHFIGNTNARGLKQDNEVITLVVRGRSNSFLGSLAESILDQASSVSESLMTEYIDEKADEFLTALHMMQQSRVKGMIFVGSLIDERVQVLQGIDIPIVFTTVNAANASLINASSVAIDDRAMGHRVADEFLRRGHRNIAVFGSNPVAGDSLSMRYQGFCDAYSQYGFQHDSSLYRESRFSVQAGYETALDFFNHHPEVSALFAMSDLVAIGAIRALKDMGKSVPEDVSVFGFDGIDISHYTIPRLATVEQPVEEIARRSLSLLFDMIDKKTEPQHILLDAIMQVRESVSDYINKKG